MNIISAYFGHNASMTVSVDGTILEVVEFERVVNQKNAGAIAHTRLQNPLPIIKMVKEYLMNKYKIKYFDLLIFNHDDLWNMRKNYFSSESEMLKFLSAEKYILVHHQHGHMASAFYQSDFQYSKGCSFDGGGSDGNFNIFECDRKNGIKQVTIIPNHTLGMRYAEFGQYSNSIKKSGANWSLEYPGKLMGLSSYGTVNEEWLPAFHKFYTGVYRGEFHKNYNTLKEELNFPDNYEGQLEADIVATAQRMFEIKFDELVRPHFGDQSQFLLSGGAAMNILNNQKLRNERKIFVPPNPSDCGLSLGFMLDYLKPEKAYDGTYAGPNVWDSHLLMEYVEKYNGKVYNFSEIVDDLIAGKIIGVVRDGAELGPRALGNRSIICHAAVPGMKDILNKKVKNRESFRPFAPVCRVDEASRYFEINGFNENRWMSFCPKVRPEYREILSSITHVDGTARLQTIKDFQHEWLYYILCKFVDKGQHPVLLNTSFNVAGKPILNTYRDAVWMLENTQMDALILQDYYIKK